MRLNVYKSMEPDGIHPRVLKELAEVVTELLSIIFEESLVIGKGNHRIITLIFKNGRKV